MTRFLPYIETKLTRERVIFVLTRSAVVTVRLPRGVTSAVAEGRSFPLSDDARLKSRQNPRHRVLRVRA